MIRQLIFGLLLFCSPLNAATSDSIQKAYYKSYNYEKMGNYTDAIKALHPILKEYQDGYTVNYRLGYLYYLNKKYANATEHYQKAIKTSPYALETHLGQMLVYLAQGKYQEAEDTGYKIVKTDYYNYYGNLRLAMTLRYQNKRETAEKIVLKMLTLYPIDTYFLAEYGILKYEAKEYATAWQVFTDMLVLDPENVIANDFLKQMEQAKHVSKN